uniref:Uncharacterized protein n=1 Tax=Pinguiococcus pyrenoidosus TaxID=172671 RepID=A0A6U0UDZ4_9STRA
MAGSVIVVTGANKGIGLNIVTRFAHAAAEALAPPLPTVLLCARDAARGEAAVEQLRANGGDPASVVKFKQLDISDEESRKRFVADVQEEFGKVDCLVNNAAIAFKGSDPTPFEEQTEPTLNVNFYSTCAFIDEMLPLLQAAAEAEDAKPRIVNVASMSGHLRILKSNELRDQFARDSLTRDELFGLMDRYMLVVKAWHIRASCCVMRLGACVRSDSAPRLRITPTRRAASRAATMACPSWG